MRTRAGYTGGTSVDPTYRNIGDHAEALQIDFDPSVISYAKLLELFWASHDPTRGHFSTQYLSAVYCADDDQRVLAESTGEAAAAREGELKTLVVPLERFYRAEDYHQKYRLRRHPDLVAELIGRFKTDQGMVDSTVAARLNGFLGGHGGRDVGDKLAALELSSAAFEIVQSRVA